MRRHAEFGLDTGDVALAPVHGVDDGDVGIDQLRQVFVAAAHDHLNTLLGRNHSQRADHVIGLDTGNGKQLPAHQAHQFVYRLDLGAQIVRHGRTVPFVFRVDGVTKSWPLGIENADRVVGRHVLAQFLQHVDHAANGAGRRTGGVPRHGAQVWHGVEGPVQIA